MARFIFSLFFLVFLVLNFPSSDAWSAFYPDKYKDLKGYHRRPIVLERDPSPPKTTKPSTTSSPKDPLFYRLPNTTIPEEYNITLTVVPSQSSFRGETRIRIRALQDTNTIVLHSNGQSFTRVTVRDLNGDPHGTSYTRPSDDRHFLIIEMRSSTLVRDRQYELVFEYTAPWGDDASGLYNSYYMASGGTRRYLASTQLSAIHAREVFPCYDEPVKKAVFIINIYVPQGYFTISNMDRVSSVLPPIVSGNEVYSFRSTPLMSTYIIAFVVCDFDYLSNTRDGPNLYPKEYRIYSKPGTTSKMQFALEFGQKSIDFLEKMTGVTYRLPKVDNIDIPGFAGGAMENWGLITYREAYLYYEKNVSDTNKMLYVTWIMSHENAHFWFGNEVTPEWWGYLWLSEGFAMFSEHYVTDNVFNGEWRLMDTFVVLDIHYVMEADSLPEAPPLNTVVGSPEEINENFNIIPYVKAGSVIRMMLHVLGQQRFQESLSNYLSSLQNGITSPQKLYDAMHGVTVGTNLLPSGVKMDEIFSTWSVQAGYPILNITRSGSRLTVTQQRFMQDTSPPGNSKWWVPLTWATSSNPSFQNTNAMDWLSPSVTSKDITINSNDDWYIFNLQRMGYYRVMYDDNNWNNLVTALKANAPIHPVNKAHLLNDAFVFCKKEIFKYKTLMDLLSYMEYETDYIPWFTANDIVSYLRPLMAGSRDYDLMEYFMEDIVTKVYNDVGFDVGTNDDVVTRKLRAIALKVNCDARTPKCLQSSEQAISREMQDSRRIPDPDLRDIIYCAGLRKASRNMWNFVLDKYTKTNDENEQLGYINSLGCSDDATIINSYLSMTLNSSSPILRIDYEYVVRAVIESGQRGFNRAIDFLYDRFLSLEPNLNSAQSSSRIIITLGDQIVSDQNKQDFERFVSKYDRDLNQLEKDAVAAARLKISENLAWVQKYGFEIEGWLANNVPVVRSHTELR